MMAEKTRKIYLLLTRFPDTTSRAVGFFANSYYTHASIGLDEDMNTFYSFVCRGLFSLICKGFMVEKINRYNRPERAPLPCSLYALSVTEKQYAAVRRVLACFEARKQRYRYARLGALLSLLHIPFRQRNHYFCSQFVAEVLRRGEVSEVSVRTARYLPWDLPQLPGFSLLFAGDLQGYSERFLPAVV